MCEEQMVRGGKVASKKNFKNKFPPKDKGSDDSDEDYVVSNDENGVSECSDEDYCSSLDEYASGEDNFVVEEEVEEQPKKVRKRGGLKARNAFGSHKSRKKDGRKMRRFSYEEEEDNEDKDDKDYSVDDDNDYEEEEEEDVDEEVEDEEVEEEDFMLEEEDFSDEEEPFVRKKGTNMKLGRHGVRKNTFGKVCKKRKPKAAKKPSRSKRRKKSGLQTVRNSDDGDFSDNYCTVKNTRRKKPVSKHKRYVAQSDLDTVLSGSSDYEYTISEEEREQVREAEKLCGHLSNRVRSVPSPPKIEDSDLRQQRKPPVRKGKEKVEEVKAEVIKQVCGICLSEEDKRRVRGTLNCCSHFFCFSCIMEWAKVESRCPLCKQRFQTISKPARSTVGIDLREVVIQVPERDQVYQPSEEELRSYLDPYENVICTECQEGGDDNLMLLCDLCDSPAHTYCVGLGREVPEGNWYCVDCRTIALGSSSPQPPSRLADRRTANNLFNRTLPVANREGLDLNSLSSPRTPYIQGFGNVTSPRLPAEIQSTSPMSQAVAPTLVRRRILRLHINQIRSSNQMGLANNRTDGVSVNPCGGGTVNLQLRQGRETTDEHTRTQETAILSQTLFQESLLHDNPSPLMQHGDFLGSETSNLPTQAKQDPHISMPTDRTDGNGTNLNPLRRLAVENTTTTVDQNLNGALWPELAGVNSLSNCEQIHHYSSVFNMGSVNGSRPPVGDEKDYCAAREQLQPIIESHLKNLSRDIDLGQSTAADIATKAACTILAACGFEHSVNEAYRASPPSQCSHVELSMGEGRRSLIKGLCSACFDTYVRDVVKKITDDASMPSWLSLTL